MTEPTHAASSLDALRRATEEHSLRVPELPLDEIEPDPAQPRTELGAETLDPQVRRELESLAANIKAIGLVQPIRVRPRPDGAGYLIVAGERRFHAARLAGLTKIPAIVDLEQGQADVRLILQISENLQRADLRLLDLAAGLERLRKTSKLKDAQIARMLGRSRAWFSHHLRPLKARGVPLEALEEGLLQSAETLRLFEKLTEPLQRRLLNEARQARSPIPRGTVAKMVTRAEAEPAGEAGDADGNGDRHYSIRLTAPDLRRLFQLVGVEAPESDEDLVARFRALLSPDGSS